MEENIYVYIRKGVKKLKKPPRFAKKFFFFRQNVKNAQHSPKTFFKSTGSREIFIKKGLRGGGGGVRA